MRLSQLLPWVCTLSLAQAAVRGAASPEENNTGFVVSHGHDGGNDEYYGEKDRRDDYERYDGYDHDDGYDRSNGYDDLEEGYGDDSYGREYDGYGGPWDRNHENSLCPNLFYDLKRELLSLFAEVDGNCNWIARSFIRAVFHDCGSWTLDQGYYGGCDGSIFLGNEPDFELERLINRGLERLKPYVLDLAYRYEISVADTIIFGANAGLLACKGGPVIQTWVGRSDTNISNPDGFIPYASDPADFILALFKAKGFDEQDVAALLGAHTVGRQYDTIPEFRGRSLDSTPNIWDVNYFAELQNAADSGINPKSNAVLPCDVALARHPSVGPHFRGFIGQELFWDQKFIDAFQRLQLLGVDPIGLVDCTDAVMTGTSLETPSSS